MTRTYWMSFVDGDRPEGQRSLGVCLVDVTTEEADALLPDLDAQYPQHGPEAHWIAAAARKAWIFACNPGGQVAFCDITNAPAHALAAYERGRLYTRKEVDAIERRLKDHGQTNHKH